MGGKEGGILRRAAENQDFPLPELPYILISHLTTKNWVQSLNKKLNRSCWAMQEFKMIKLSFSTPPPKPVIVQ